MNLYRLENKNLTFKKFSQITLSAFGEQNIQRRKKKNLFMINNHNIFSFVKST